MNKTKTTVVFLLLAAIACTNKPVTKTADQPTKTVNPEKAEIFVTAKDTSLRLTQTADVSFEEFGQPLETQVCVFVDPAHTFQTIIGIGGVLTDASAEVFAKLPEETQKEFLTACYDTQKGIGYKFARTNIASCDFSSDIYSYVAENDTALNTFNVDHDQQFRIPFIKQAIAAAGGAHLELSEHMLGKEYFPNNNLQMRPDLKEALVHYYDFMVGYQNLLRDGGTFNSPQVASADTQST
ncbi:MAG: glycoside hydrolase family 66 protein [Bacteroidota bacterium]|nr:glycoside hydrolase family 66 protein [Bacteroidota bacterium]